MSPSTPAQAARVAARTVAAPEPAPWAASEPVIYPQSGNVGGYGVIFAAGRCCQEAEEQSGAQPGSARPRLVRRLRVESACGLRARAGLWPQFCAAHLVMFLLGPHRFVVAEFWLGSFASETIGDDGRSISAVLSKRAQVQSLLGEFPSLLLVQEQEALEAELASVTEYDVTGRSRSSYLIGLVTVIIGLGQAATRHAKPARTNLA